MEKLTISQMAKKANVNVETIRYYERRGLLPTPPRNEIGYRQYSIEDLRRIRFIRRAKELGFTLREIMELLSLKMEPGTACRDVKNKVQAKVADIETRIESLKRMKAVLANLSQMCAGKGPASQCPILDALDK
jgi:MerR family mercuric resistance operon transcriptional regulator